MAAAPRTWDDETERNLLAQNDEATELLAQRVGQMKAVALEIRGDVRESQSSLEGMGDVLDSAKQVLANTIGRVEALLQEGGPKRTLLLVAALFLLLLFLYYYVL